MFGGGRFLAVFATFCKFSDALLVMSDALLVMFVKLDCKFSDALFAELTADAIPDAPLVAATKPAPTNVSPMFPEIPPPAMSFSPISVRLLFALLKLPLASALTVLLTLPAVYAPGLKPAARSSGMDP